ncbi:MAG TPA: hypothetical protein VFC22_05595, partial [Solirubrobacteraceae bacterium]|nr:hypothetical protein [Solirubrobacteraceae bacterium]
MAVAVTAPPSTAVVPRRGQFLRTMPMKAKVGGVILAVFVLIAIFGPLLAPYDPSATSPLATGPVAPTLHHLFGTTSTGQDVLSQLLV